MFPRSDAYADTYADADLEAIFRSRTADGHAGYGLGLAITRRIVAAHGGSVRAANRPEGGLLMTLLLPMA